jgi:uncharacterized protein (TIGR02118 family)
MTAAARRPKPIALMRARSDLAPGAVRALYEDEHAPLVMRLMPMIRDYRRNYIDLQATALVPGAAWPDFDIVTELWFDDVAGLEAFLLAMAEGPEGQALRADSARFLVRGATRMLRVDEEVTASP